MESKFSVENVIPTGGKRNAAPPKRLDVVDHEDFGLVNDKVIVKINKEATSVVKYCNTVTSYINSLD